MSYIGKITTGGSTYHVGSTLYGTCDTAAGTAIKVAVVEGFDTLETGVTVHIKFTNSNTASNPSLEIRPSSTSGQQASHAIFVDETRRPGTTAFTSWFSGSVVSFTYDGSYWRMNDYIPNTDTNDAVTQTATDSTNATYEFLFSNTADNTTRTEGARKTQYLTFNPSKKALTVGSRASGSAVGDYSLGIGESVTASAINSFAIGNNASAQSNYGVAIGLGSKSRHRSQFVFGEYNIMDNKAGVTIPIDRGNYIEVVGNGTSSVRSNARTLDWDGNEWLAGSLVASSVSAVDSNSNTNTSISPTGLATYTVPSGSQAISTGLYTTSDDIVLYSGTVTNTWDGTNTSLKTAIGRLKDGMDFFTLINAEAVTSTATQKTLYSDRKFSDYSMLVFVAIDNQIRSSITFPSSMFSTLGNPASLTWVDSANTQYWIEVTYVSDTKISVKCKSGVSGKLLYVFGLMKK